MSSPPISSSSSRRIRYSRSPSNSQNPPLKRSKPSSSADAAQNADQQRVYTSICVKNINPEISDAGIYCEIIVENVFSFDSFKMFDICAVKSFQNTELTR